MTVAEAVAAAQVKLRAVLQGDTLRVIYYGAVGVAWLIAHGLAAAGVWHLAPDFDAISLAVGAAIVLLTEFARNFVYSPAAVAKIIADFAEEIDQLLAAKSGTPPPPAPPA